jgi:glycosyltransferase involved in cell wall biosynthesis
MRRVADHAPTAEPMVSVVCIAYNHEKFIRAALDSFLAQKTSFAVEVLVHDDASTDRTAEIIRSYEAEYPHVIRPKYQVENQFSRTGFEFSHRELERSRGRYIALCEGDDYWADPSKLQRQVEFLESNPEFSFAFHRVNVVLESGGTQYDYAPPATDVLTFNDLLFRIGVPTSSVVFRRRYLSFPLPAFLPRAAFGDIPIELLLLDRGPAKYFPEPMGIYRKHPKSLTRDRTHLSKARRAYLFVYKNLRQHFGWRHWFPLTAMILKTRVGYLRDVLGLNPSLR